MTDDYSMVADLITSDVYRMRLGGGPVALIQRDLQHFVPYTDE
jgi:hypothetical protein